MRVWVLIEDTGTTSAVDGWILHGVFASEELATDAVANAEHPEWTTVLACDVVRFPAEGAA